jgi:hypothetical protein
MATRAKKDSNHVFIFEVYDNAAALGSASGDRSFQEICGDQQGNGRRA